MEKSYPAAEIKKISEQSLIYEDEYGTEQAISLLKCRDNWYKYYNGKETLVDKAFQKRRKCRYVSDRFCGHDEAYLIFFSDIRVRFKFNFRKHVKLDDACEAR